MKFECTTGALLLTFLVGGLDGLLLLPLLYVLYVGFLCLAQGHLLFPVTSLAPQHVEPPRHCKVSWVDDEDGASSSEAWFFRGNLDRPMPTVFIFHANAECISSYVHDAEWFTSQGFNVMLPEYRGYGRSTGTPCEAGIVKDVARHFENLKADPFFDPDNIVFLGVSIGGGVASAVARVVPPRAIALVSTFYSMPRVCRQYLVPECLAARILSSTFNNRRNLEVAVKKHGVPVFLAHGTEDTIVPFSHAQALADELGLDVYSKPCQHNFPLDNEYQRRFLQFLRPLFPTSPLIDIPLASNASAP